MVAILDLCKLSMTKGLSDMNMVIVGIPWLQNMGIDNRIKPLPVSYPKIYSNSLKMAAILNSCKLGSKEITQ